MVVVRVAGSRVNSHGQIVFWQSSAMQAGAWAAAAVGRQVHPLFSRVCVVVVVVFSILFYSVRDYDGTYGLFVLRRRHPCMYCAVQDPMTIDWLRRRLEAAAGGRAGGRTRRRWEGGRRMWQRGRDSALTKPGLEATYVAARTEARPQLEACQKERPQTKPSPVHPRLHNHHTSVQQRSPRAHARPRTTTTTDRAFSTTPLRCCSDLLIVRARTRASHRCGQCLC